MIRILSGALALALVSTAAGAVTVTVNSINATWRNAVLLAPGTPAEIYIGNGTPNASVRWGDAPLADRSGYDFNAAAIPPTVLTPPADSAAFSFGTFTHVNFPIQPPSISAIELVLDLNVDIDGQIFTPEFIFDFSHEETTNSLDPCPYGGANGQGVNINGCADRVTVSVNSFTDSVNIGGFNYTLAISGFQVNGVQVSEFLTIERANNSAELVGRLTLRRNVVVPTPATVALFGLGIAGVAFARRRAA